VQLSGSEFKEKNMGINKAMLVLPPFVMALVLVLLA
jgi:hypothetical protein